MRLSELISYYSRRSICEELVNFAKDREIAVRFGELYGKRPDTLQFPADITRQVRNGATSFHCSEERWSNPLNLKTESEKRDLDGLRIGFDLVLDIDCKILEWSKICAKLLTWALETHSIKSYGIKFSGGTGFHIGVPWEAFAMDERLAFPDTAQTIAKYLREYIRQPLAREIVKLEQDVKSISQKSGKRPSEFIQNNAFDPYKVLEIDTILIAPRHLFRMPYSLNEKKWLVSLPIKPKDIDAFSVEWAKPGAVTDAKVRFIDTGKVERGEAMQLLMQALDWDVRNREKRAVRDTVKVEYSDKVPVEAFPPCMQTILQGLPDGRKRSLFSLINFLRNAKWGLVEIQQLVQEWNLKNKPPLKQGYVQSQLSWHLRQATKFPPPNCKSFYQDIGICKPDFTCGKVRNPLSYPSRQKVIKH